MNDDCNTKHFIHQLPDSLFDKNISFIELKIFLLISRFGYSGQSSTFTNRYAALKLNVSVRTIQRGLVSLEEKGLIAKRTFTVHEKSKKTAKRVLNITYSPNFNTKSGAPSCE